MTQHNAHVVIHGLNGRRAASARGAICAYEKIAKQAFRASDNAIFFNSYDIAKHSWGVSRKLATSVNQGDKILTVMDVLKCIQIT